MSLLAYLRCLAVKVLHRSEIAEDVNEELRSHVQHRADDLERSGLARAEAERRARIQRGVFTEAVLISLLGGAVGLWGAFWCCAGSPCGSHFPETFPYTRP